jgi:hypothetical protein
MASALGWTQVLHFLAVCEVLVGRSFSLPLFKTESALLFQGEKFDFWCRMVKERRNSASNKKAEILFFSDRLT